MKFNSLEEKAAFERAELAAMREKNLKQIEMEKRTSASERMLGKQAEKDPADELIARGRQMAEQKRGVALVRDEKLERKFAADEDKKRGPGRPLDAWERESR